MIQTQDLAEQPAEAYCEHYWEYRVRGGSPISVRMCRLCPAIDWDDLDEQAAALVAAEQKRVRELALAVRKSCACDPCKSFIAGLAGANDT